MSNVLNFPAPPTTLEKMKAAFSRLGVLAANYLPQGFKDTMLDMAAQSDKNSAEIAALKLIMAELQMVMLTPQPNGE
jgi:hypothetical protein